MENGQNSWSGVVLMSVQIWLFVLKLLGADIPWVVVLLPLLIVCGAMVLAVIVLCVVISHSDTDGEQKEGKDDEHTA